MLEYLRTWYGSTKVAFAAHEPDKQQALTEYLLTVCRKHGRSPGPSLIALSGYVEVIATI